MDLPSISNIEFEDTPERLKVAMPLIRNWPFFVLYSVMLLGWVGVTGWMLGLLFRQDIIGLPTLFAIVYVIIVLVWAYIWYRLGKSVWRWWQFYAATRELLFIEPGMLVIRRPLSLLGVTDAYDMRHVGPFRFSEKYNAVAFSYGSRGGLFGTGLTRPEAEQLILALNQRYFPHALLAGEDEAEEG